MLSHGYPPTISGVSLVAQKLARAMVRRGHTLTLVTGSQHGNAYREEDEGVIVERVPSWPNPYWTEGRLPIASHKRFRDILETTQPDIVHSHDSGFLGFRLVREDRNGEVPKVITCHFLPKYVTRYIGWIDSLKRPIEKTVWEVAVRLMNQFDRAVFPTKTQQLAFIQHGLETQSAVISNGVDTTRYRLSTGGDLSTVEKYKLPDGPRVLFVGRLALDKDIETLIRAMAVPWAEYGAHLVIVGRGDDRKRLEDLARAVNLEKCVRFMGFVPEEDLPAIYRECDLFTIAAKVEVQSIPTLQAVASAMPVVAVNAAALPELVHDGESGYLVPAGNAEAVGRAVVDILDDVARARRFGEASLEISIQHREEATFDAYERLYVELLQKEGRGNSKNRPITSPAVQVE